MVAVVDDIVVVDVGEVGFGADLEFDVVVDVVVVVGVADVVVGAVVAVIENGGVFVPRSVAVVDSIVGYRSENR